ncbi:hypothetical protein D4764_04G0001340 [Takifugu flavidus]|uniref:Uncharacterized protein n=1 Tax=Takifugu flavidus TaxID=433684 RepID=A0A5C6N6Y8_9TELE|nr:hypothetical protein D4764_04G0001340 [Takifugu flavidus]
MPEGKKEHSKIIVSKEDTAETSGEQLQRRRASSSENSWLIKSSRSHSKRGRSSQSFEKQLAEEQERTHKQLLRQEELTEQKLPDEDETFQTLRHLRNPSAAA